MFFTLHFVILNSSICATKKKRFLTRKKRKEKLNAEHLFRSWPTKKVANQNSFKTMRNTSIKICTCSCIDKRLHTEFQALERNAKNLQEEKRTRKMA